MADEQDLIPEEPEEELDPETEPAAGEDPGEDPGDDPGEDPGEDPDEDQDEEEDDGGDWYTEGRDLIDDLIDDLNDGVDYVTFDRDVLDTDRPDDWAAVELTGQDDSEWADGHLIEQVLTADIWVCISSRGTQVKRDVQKVLKAFGKAHDIGWRLAARAYLYDLHKVMWRWVVTIYGPLATEEEET